MILISSYLKQTQLISSITLLTKLSIIQLSSSAGPMSTVTVENTKATTRNSRLSKLVAETSLCSRREAERWITEGRVTINDMKVTSSSRVINRDTDKVCLDGALLMDQSRISRNNSELPKLWAVYKTAGELVALRDDTRQRPCLLQRLNHLAPPTLLRPILHQEFNTEV